MQTLQALEISENVVNLMTEKLRELPDSAQEALRLASCIGSQFDLSILTIIAQSKAEALRSSLKTALRERVIIVQNDHYMFSHDRLQQAAYSLISDTQKKATHLKIGNLLLRNVTDQERDTRIFDIANHMNLGMELIASEQDRIVLAELNRDAGQKAMAASAFQAAANYFEQGVCMLPESAWDQQYPLTLSLYLYLGDTALLIGSFDKAERTLKSVEEHAKTVLDQIRGYKILMSLYQLQGYYEKALVIQQRGLELLGYHTPQTRDEIERQTAATFADVEKRLQDKDIAQFATLRQTESQEHSAAMSLYMGMEIAGRLSGKLEYFHFGVVQAVDLSLTHGNCVASPNIYMNFGMYLSGVRKFALGYQFGAMAYELYRTSNHPELGSRVSFYFGVLYPWTQSIQGAIEYYDEAFSMGLTHGEWVYPAYAAVLGGNYNLIGGERLGKIKEKAERQLRFLEKTKKCRYTRPLARLYDTTHI